MGPFTGCGLPHGQFGNLDVKQWDPSQAVILTTGRGGARGSPSQEIA